MRTHPSHGLFVVATDQEIMAKQQFSLGESTNTDSINTGSINTVLSRLARAIFSPPVQNDVNLASSATLNAQIWLGQFPWRPTAGWTVIAALLATGLVESRFDLDWKTLALLLLLVDPLWGSLWRLAAGRAELLPLHSQAVSYEVWLPYLRPGSPAARLLGWNNAGALPLLFRVALPSLCLTGALAVVLGAPAVWMTALVMVVSLLGWVSRRTLQRTPALLHSIVTIALPWLLTINLLDSEASAAQRAPQITLLVLWVLHNWGEGRAIRSGIDWFGLALLAVAEISLITLFVLAQAPLWIAPLLVLCLPTWLLIAQGQSVQRANVWWLLAMLLSGLALSN